MRLRSYCSQRGRPPLSCRQLWLTCLRGERSPEGAQIILAVMIVFDCEDDFQASARPCEGAPETAGDFGGALPKGAAPPCGQDQMGALLHLRDIHQVLNESGRVRP